MTSIKTLQRPALPFDRWERGDMRLESARHLVRLLSEVVDYAEYGTMPEGEPDADLLSAPLEMVWFLRQTADWIEAWTDLDHTL